MRATDVRHFNTGYDYTDFSHFTMRIIMEQAIRLRVMVGDDHVVHLSDEIPPGEAEIIVLFPSRTAHAQRAEARKQMFGRLAGEAIMADDFDAPLPEEVLNDFEGGRSP